MQEELLYKNLTYKTFDIFGLGHQLWRWKVLPFIVSGVSSIIVNENQVSFRVK